MAKNPFGDDEPGVPTRVNPFGDEPEPDNFDDALTRIEHAGRKIRQLRTQLGAEGLTISATREMMTQLGSALESTARALKELAERRD
jgi:flagellin-like hook-associated protein FlgL